MPKELLRRGLLTGTEKLNGQLRDAAEGGQREETEIERAQNSARTTTQKAVNRLEKTAHRKKKARNGKSKTHTDTGRTSSGVPSTDIQAEKTSPTDRAEPVQIKTKATVRQSSSAKNKPTDPPGFEPSQIKTKNACIQRQTAVPEHESAITNTVSSECRMPHIFQQDQQKFVRGRQKQVAVQGRESYRESECAVPVRQRDAGGLRSQYTPALSAQDGKSPTENVARGTIPNSKRRIKEARSGSKTVGRTPCQTVKGVESSRKIFRVGGHSAQSMGQAARTAVQVRQRVVQAAGAAKRTAAAVGRPMVKAATAALRGTVAAFQAALVPLATGGGAVFAVVLVLCLAGAILASPLGIFFSFFEGDSGDGQQQTTITISTVVQELNQEYDAQLNEIRVNASYNEESIIGSPAPWPEVLAVYAVKTASDLTNGQEVVTMTDGKKAILEQVFWDMNELSSFTSTVPGEGDDGEDTTTLYITVTARTANEMADIYGFNTDQRRQLADLLSDEYREMWNGVL